MSDCKGSPLFIDRSAVVTYIFQMVKVSYLVFCKLFHSSKKIVVMKNVIFKKFLVNSITDKRTETIIATMIRDKLILEGWSPLCQYTFLFVCFFLC